MRFSDRVGYEIKDGKVLLLSRDKGSRLIISKNCFDIIRDAINKNYSRELLISTMFDEIDKTFMSKLLNTLFDKEMLCDENNIAYISPKTATLLVTNRCNLKCTHCCADAEELSIIDPMDTFAIYKCIDQLVILGVETIVFSGGEPLIRNDIWEILTYARRVHKGTIDLMTNATLINSKNYEELLSLVDRFSISIDGYNEDTCSIIRGKGIFNKVYSALELLKTKTDEIFLSMVLTPQNMAIKNEFLELNNKLGTHPILREFAVGEVATNNIDLWGDNVLSVNPYDLHTDICDVSFLSCGGIYHEIAIRSDGMIVPCPLMSYDEFILTDIMNCNDLREVFRLDKLCELSGYNNFMSYFPENHKFCSNCGVNQHCWHCPHDIYLSVKYSRGLRDRCNKRKSILNRIVWETSKK